MLYRNFNRLFQDFNNYVGWRSGAFPGTDSYVLPTHNPLEGPYPDVIGPYPSGQYPAKPTASNISNSGATITWYTYEQAASTVVQVGTDPNNLNMETDCGPSTYTGTDNLWVNNCDISSLQPGYVVLLWCGWYGCGQQLCLFVDRSDGPSHRRYPELHHHAVSCSCPVSESERFRTGMFSGDFQLSGSCHPSVDVLSRKPPPSYPR